ncbi:MAG TPA: hypothetical protein VKA51_06830 [Rubrobacteraceae bacterium]|nr:hypothetical protein [Rubrobacteraceae bacterium]
MAAKCSELRVPGPRLRPCRPVVAARNSHRVGVVELPAQVEDLVTQPLDQLALGGL